MTTHSPASRNQSDNGTVAGMLRLVLGKFLQHVDDMLPAQVIAYDAAKNLAQVQPLISMVTTDNMLVSRAQVASVPVFQVSGGGFVLNFPISTGDLGWLKANDRDISLFKQTGGKCAPNTQRKHSFEDAIFIPQAARSLITVAAEDIGNAVLQSYDGTVRLALWAGMLKITAPHMGIGDTPGFAPNANAVLDLQSTTKSFMPPRMTQAQRDAIPSPTEGMMVWNLTTHALSTYNGSTWS
jgi:hypothetical protein